MLSCRRRINHSRRLLFAPKQSKPHHIHRNFYLVDRKHNPNHDVPFFRTKKDKDGLLLYPEKPSHFCSIRWYHRTPSHLKENTSSHSKIPNPTHVRIGNVSRHLGLSHSSPSIKNHEELIPRGYLSLFSSSDSTFLSHLQWMMQKDVLGQDILLVGPPNTMSYRRRLAYAYAEMVRREVEILTLTSDATESDLKQRRELRTTTMSGGLNNGNSMTSVFVDQAPVRAAVHGRLLVLEGIERAERNVLPTLNNLLENREMHLEDGRLLVPFKRYQEIETATNNDSASSAINMLRPTHDDFRVIALGCPVPPFEGNPLDPPLRSRFQIRRIDNPPPSSLIPTLPTSKSHPDDAKLLASFGGIMDIITNPSSKDSSSTIAPLNRPSTFPTITSLPSTSQLMFLFPRENVREILSRAYPFGNDLFVKNLNKADRSVIAKVKASNEAFSLACEALSIDDIKQKDKNTQYILQSIDRIDNHTAHITFAPSQNPTSDLISLTIPCGPHPLSPLPSFTPTPTTLRTLTPLLQNHIVNRDTLLIGPKGDGKTAIAKQFASLLGYPPPRTIHCHYDVTSRDLFARRGTDGSGETIWVDSPLMEAARRGEVCVLDGVESLSEGVLGCLGGLVLDREGVLPDGRRFVGGEGEVGEDNNEGVVRIHPSFRIIALGTVGGDGKNFLTDDVIEMFKTVVMNSPSDDCVMQIIKEKCPTIPIEILKKVLKLRRLLTKDDIAAECGVNVLSIRNVIRIARSYAAAAKEDNRHDDDELGYQVGKVLMMDLLPSTQRDNLKKLLMKANIPPPRHDTFQVPTDSPITDTLPPPPTSPRPFLIPSPLFYPIPSHTTLIQHLLLSHSSGERSFLLLGNQGVGKNVIIDRLLHQTNTEREYVQLHRDSTVAQLTISPTLVDGRIVYEDSPLVRAVKRGCALVVDEADKAPVEVVGVLKSLVEDGDMTLADGRRIVRRSAASDALDDDVIPIHPDFTVYVLANPPRFPFTGNDFFRDCGDCFSCFAVPSPDLRSEMMLLKSYAPSVDDDVIKKIARSFEELRRMADEGDMNYPYSTREAVAVVKHLERYAGERVNEEEMSVALRNVLDIDSFDGGCYETIDGVFQKYGMRLHRFDDAIEEAMASNDGFSLSRLLSSRSNGTKEQRRNEEEKLSLRYYTDDHTSTENTSHAPPPSTDPKLGKWDSENTPHVGGNQWAGGTGGSDTAGLGGRGGPYRLDRGHDVHQISDAAKDAVDQDVRDKARRLGEKAFRERLRDIDASRGDWEAYRELLSPVETHVETLRRILRSVESTSHEETTRGWLKRQSHGEIDDARLVDGVVGDRYIYKRRGDVLEVDRGGRRRRRMKFLFVVDCSGSMYRFNGMDGRLTRCLETTALVMESFAGISSDDEMMGRRFQYAIVGHSGDSECIPLVDFDRPPKNEKERIKVLRTMVAHSQFCFAGDNTLQAVKRAMRDIVVSSRDGVEEDDDCIVVALSDANLRRYGIHPKELGKIMMNGAGQGNNSKGKTPKAYCIFIASFGREADMIKEALPLGRGFVCMDTADLPAIVRSILATHVQ